VYRLFTSFELVIKNEVVNMVEFSKIDVCVYENGEFGSLKAFVKHNKLESQFKEKFGCEIEKFDIDETDFDYEEPLDYMVNLLNTDTERYFTTYIDDSDYFRVDYIKLSEKKEE
jgi:hypothetical protein